MIRMLRPNIHWVPGRDGPMAKADMVEVDLDKAVDEWMKSVSIDIAGKTFSKASSFDTFVKENYLKK